MAWNLAFSALASSCRGKQSSHELCVEGQLSLEWLFCWQYSGAHLIILHKSLERNRCKKKKRSVNNRSSLHQYMYTCSSGERIPGRFDIWSSSFTSSVITMIASGIGQCRQTFQIDENDHEKYDFAEADFFDVACVLGRPSCRVASIPAVQGG